MSNPKVLIIGARTPGGVGESVKKMLESLTYPIKDARTGERYLEFQIDAPNADVLNVADGFSIHDWLEKNGPYNYIVYSAGLNKLSWIHDLHDMYDIEDTFDVNVFGFIRLLSSHENLFPDYDGSIVAVASDAARNAMRGSMTYCSSKAALVMAAKVAARELSPRWRVNTVSPAVIADTPMSKDIDALVPSFRGWDPEKMREYEKTQLPLQRRANVGEVATVIVNVLFGPAYQTGSDVDISGGK